MPSSAANYYTCILFSVISLTKIAPRILMHMYFFPKTERRTLGHVVTFNGGINTLGNAISTFVSFIWELSLFSAQVD
jgi:hypothetical protein